MNGEIDINLHDKIVFKSLYDMPQWIRHHGLLRVDARRVADKTVIVSRVDGSMYGSSFRFITFMECDTGDQMAAQVCAEMVDHVVRNNEAEEEYEDSDELTSFIDGFMEVP